MAAVEVCSPTGLNRVIRLAKLDSIRAPDQRSPILTLFEQINLTTDVFPVSRFLYKIRLNSPEAQTKLVEALTKFNRNMREDGPLFHSLWDGNTTTSLLYRAPPRTPAVGLGRGWGPLRGRQPQAGALVVTDPPFSLKLSVVAAWMHHKNIFSAREPRWGISPSGSTCVLIDFFPDGEEDFRKDLSIVIERHRLN